MKQKFILIASIISLIFIQSCSEKDVEEAIIKPSIIIDSYSPVNGLPGDIITIIGENFGPTTTLNKVKFGDIDATILSSSTTQIEVEVPNNLTSTNSQITLIVDNETKTVGNFNILTDDFNYLTITSIGELFKIGNNTGYVESFGSINTGFNFIMNTITNVSSKIYVVEYGYNPGPVNNLLIYDKITDQTEVVPLELPSSIVGEEPIIYTLEWDETNQRLIGFLNTNGLGQGVPTSYLITINSNDYSVTNTGITFEQNSSTSMVLSNDKIYSASFDSDFMDINLSNNSFSTIEFNGEQLYATRLTKTDQTDILMAMKFDSNYEKGYNPVALDLTNKSITELSNSTDYTYGFSNKTGKGFFINHTYVNIVSDYDFSVGVKNFGVISYDTQTEMFSFVKIRNDNLDRTILVIDIVD